MSQRIRILTHTTDFKLRHHTLHTTEIAKRRREQDARTAGHWPDRPARPLTEPPRAQPLCEHDTRVSTGDTD